jgi:hypothetical protein
LELRGFERWPIGDRGLDLVGTMISQGLVRVEDVRETTREEKTNIEGKKIKCLLVARIRAALMQTDCVH